MAQNSTDANNKDASKGGDQPKKEEPAAESITSDTLRADKNFNKLLKKQLKELEVLKKKHNKDK